jgi:hypothetical protein
MMNDKLKEKFPRIVVTKISNGFLVGIFPENKDLQKMMQHYVKDIMGSLQNIDGGDEWKEKMQKNIDKAMKADSNDNMKLLACKDVYEVMAILAPVPEGDTLKEGMPDLNWFWSEEGHVPD